VTGSGQTEVRSGAALVTGASSGIGAELAVRFAREGHNVVLVGRSAERLARVAQRIACETRVQSDIIIADLAADGAVEEIAAALQRLRLAPAFIVNAAGFGLFGNAGKLGVSEQLSIITVNCRALTELTLRLLPSALEQGGGVLNVGSVGGFFPGPGMAVYFASKAYVQSVTQALRAEYFGTGLRVSALCPGPVATAFQGRARMVAPRLPRLLRRDAESVALAGYRGLMRNRAVVVPGFWNFLMVAAGGVIFHRAFVSFVRRYHFGRRTRYRHAETKPVPHVAQRQRFMPAPVGKLPTRLILLRDKRAVK
jgi:hypothetical protein